MKSLLIFIVTLNLVGCMTLPVQGEFKDGSEKFWGDATGYSAIFYPAFGPINILSDQGAKCDGSFHYYWFNRGGEGSFNCKDGRIGDFFFSSNGTEGKGFGRDDKGNLFVFQFGGPEYTAARAVQWQALANSFDSMSRANRPSTSYCTQYGNSYRCTHYSY